MGGEWGGGAKGRSSSRTEDSCVSADEILKKTISMENGGIFERERERCVVGDGR